jgi:membrane protein YdbS with pleckstrin-like domain
MTTRVARTGAWLYQGLWGILTQWFRVPSEPPTLPVAPGETVTAFQPAPGWLRYLMCRFWLGLLIAVLAILANSLAVTAAEPVIGLLMLAGEVLLTIAPACVAYVAMHLRYDTTWYVMTDRSLRIRRGIWVIHETTITYENVQNVSVNQGPLQRFFGIADVVVETAGGGGTAQAQQAAAHGGGAHCGLIEGITDAARIRDLLVSRMRRSRTAGLGDEPHDHEHNGWTPPHVALLREVRDAARALANPPA